MPEDQPDPDLEDARIRAARYDAAGRLGKAALKITQQAPDQVERERLRRHQIGVEGRLAEDIARAVDICVPVWDLLAEKALFADISRPELVHIREALVGRTSDSDPQPQVSLRFHDDEVNVAAVRNLIPAIASPHRVDGYRYATWEALDTGVVEPFLVALNQRATGIHTVVATMFVGATFLRYEQQLGAIRRRQLDRLALAVSADIRLIVATRTALVDA